MTFSNSAAPSERVLVLLPPGPDNSLARAVLDQAGITFHPCTDVAALAREIEDGAGAALLAEEMLDPATLRSLVGVLERQEVWSDFPLVVFFGSVGPTPRTSLRMLDILKPLGNVTVLERPVRTMTLVSALQAAVRGRRRQYEVRELLRQREEAVRDSDDFLMRLAHELRNPLGAIRSATQIMEQVGATNSLIDGQRAVIARQTDRLARLVNGVLEVHRLTSGRISLCRHSVNLFEVLERALRTAHVAGRNREANAEPLAIEGDAEQLERVFCHLFAEAALLAPRGLSWRATRAGEEAVLRVKMPGLEWPERGQPAFLERFTDVLRLLDQPQGGLLVGLLLVRNLVELHAGSVRADGAGDELVIRLPLAPARTEPSAPSENGAGTGVAKRILVVEDNRDSRESLRLLLQLWGYTVEVAEDGKQAVRMARAVPPEVALVDIGLPDLDGYEVARQLRAALGPAVFLIALTGYGGPHDSRRAVEAGFDVHLVKPLIPESLRELLAGPATAS